MEKLKITPSEGVLLKQTGTFDFATVYSGIVKFLKDYGYSFHEKEHKQKDKPLGKEFELKFEANKEINNVLKSTFEVEIKMKKIKDNAGLFTGNLKVTVHAYLVVDYKKEWTDKKFKKFLLKINQKYIRKEQIDYYKKQTKEELDDLLNYMKDVLGLEV